MIDDFFPNKNKKNRKKTVLLIFAEAWGVSLNVDNNAIRKAEIPFFKHLVAKYPVTVIKPSSLSVSESYRAIGLSQSGEDSSSMVSFSLSQILAQYQAQQLKIAESSNFPLISSFLNNKEDPFLYEDWEITPKKKSGFLNFLKTENLLTKRMIEAIRLNKYDLIVSSWDNISREVLRGDFSATIAEVERTVEALNKIVPIILSTGGTLIFTSTYGGAEDVFNIQTNLANKKRSSSALPFLIIDSQFEGKTIGLKEAPNNDISLLTAQGSYLDIAPTVLSLLNLRIPISMEGKSLI